MLADTANPVYTIRNGEAFAGLIGFKSADAEKHSIEIGYWLREEQQEKGVMTAAVRALCETAFTQMGMRRIEIRCGVGNLPSNRIPQRLGFLRSHVEQRGEELSDGEWIDLNVEKKQSPVSMCRPLPAAVPAALSVIYKSDPTPTLPQGGRWRTPCPVRTIIPNEGGLPAGSLLQVRVTAGLISF